MPGNPMEQLPLNFNAPEESASPERKLTAESTTELEQRYHQAVGYDPTHRFRGLTEEERREILIEGIQNPEAGKDRLSREDLADDQETTRTGWWNK